jgi:hypothetical protein
MQRSLEGKRYSHAEMCIHLQETAQIVNRRLLYLGQWAEGDPICLADLLLGKAKFQAQLIQFKISG